MTQPPSQQLMDRVRSELDVPPELFAELDLFRRSEDYRRIYEHPKPLVTVLICTHDRRKLLTERSVPSVLNQTYDNLEVLIVGDGCTDDTEAAIAALGDRRVRFENRPRGKYPDEPVLRWMVAGTVPANYGLSIAAGDLVTHLDDDDEYLPDRIEKLVAFVQGERTEVVWHPFSYEIRPDQWVAWPAKSFDCTAVTNGSVLYISWFKRVAYDPTSYRYPEPADWNRFRKFKYLGAHLARHPEQLLRHYGEGSQRTASVEQQPK